MLQDCGEYHQRRPSTASEIQQAHQHFPTWIHQKQILHHESARVPGAHHQGGGQRQERGRGLPRFREGVRQGTNSQTTQETQGTRSRGQSGCLGESLADRQDTAGQCERQVLILAASTVRGPPRQCFGTGALHNIHQ